MRCDRVIYKTPLSLKAFSTFIAQDADSVGYHMAFHKPFCVLDLSTNLTGERSYSSVKSSSTAVTCDQMFATCVENNQIFVPTSENTWNYESSMERKTSLVTSVVRVTQPSNIYKFTRANIPVRNLIAVRNVEKHLLTQVLWKITRNSTNTTSRSHVRYVERLLRSRRTWKTTWWYTTQTVPDRQILGWARGTH